jgi:hypothetical protein
VNQQQTAEGTVTTPTFYDGPAEVQGDEKLHQRFFTYRTDAGLVVGYELNVMFTLERPASTVWRYVRDSTLWQGGYGYHYSDVLGELYSRDDLGLGTETFRITVKNNPDMMAQLGLPPDGEFVTGDYVVLRVIPEHLIVQFQPVPTDGSNGGISPGFHVTMLNEHEGKTVVTINMEHATRVQDKTEDQALADWRDYSGDPLAFWRDHFIPTLKNLVHNDTTQ